MTDRSLTQVIEDFSGALLALDGVEGVYEGRSADGEPVITVAVRETNKDLENRVRAILEGYPVVFNETGEIGLHDPD